MRKKNQNIIVFWIVCVNLSFTYIVNCQQTCLLTGADQTYLYFPLLQGKKVAVVANQTSFIGSTPLVDSLIRSNIRICKILTPEHGFWGIIPDGKPIADSTYRNIPVISLYGEKKKPTSADLKDVNIVLYDIQDVGVRFYTYISTLYYIMESCLENNIPLVILDRPNPNGFYVDGFVLKPQFKSFIGMLPIPIVYGLTPGELAWMINEERWLSAGKKIQLTVIPCKGYDHNTRYVPPIKPSPNLTSIDAIYLYPTVGLLEGTTMSVGRGTLRPFELIGHPALQGDTSFTPIPIAGMSDNPPYAHLICHGFNLKHLAQLLKTTPHIHIELIIQLYQSFKEMGKEKEFFKPAMFDKLAGTDELRKLIISGKNANEIRSRWKEEVEAFKAIRKKYLLYPDFEN
ncbi:MAG: DUF1343 domain-containing protein [Bacteroidales bacterium]|nr:DUF1343 domain-containing protein [Bacteroidales bacterium]